MIYIDFCSIFSIVKFWVFMYFLCWNLSFSSSITQYGMNSFKFVRTRSPEFGSLLVTLTLLSALCFFIIVVVVNSCSRSELSDEESISMGWKIKWEIIMNLLVITYWDSSPVSQSSNIFSSVRPIILQVKIWRLLVPKKDARRVLSPGAQRQNLGTRTSIQTHGQNISYLGRSLTFCRARSAQKKFPYREFSHVILWK